MVFTSPPLLRAKILEEAAELADFQGRDNLVWEAADLLYHTAVLLSREGVAWREVLSALKGRMR